jgi:hypothetical protein
MSSPLIIALAAEGRPGVHLQISPVGFDSTLNVLLTNESQGSSDFSADTFAAAVTDEDGTKTDLAIATSYDETNDRTVLVITFPGIGIPNCGSFGVRWTTANSGNKWPITGSFERKSLIP